MIYSKINRRKGNLGRTTLCAEFISAQRVLNYLGGLLGESKRKNLSQIATDAVEVTYHRLHHFLTEAPWSSDMVNERRLQVMNKCNQTRICSGFSLIVDDSGHRKSRNFTAGVGRQYLGEIGKTQRVRAERPS